MKFKSNVNVLRSSGWKKNVMGLRDSKTPTLSFSLYSSHDKCVAKYIINQSLYILGRDRNSSVDMYLRSLFVRIIVVVGSRKGEVELWNRRIKALTNLQ